MFFEISFLFFFHLENIENGEHIWLFGRDNRLKPVLEKRRKVYKSEHL